MKSMQSAPLAPDHHLQDRDFDVGDFDGERELQRQGFVRTGDRPYRNKQLIANRRPPLARRMFRGVTRFVLAVLIGVGLTLVWQSYGEQATEVASLWAPSLARMLPATTAKTPSEAEVLPQLAQQMKLIGLDVAIVRRSIGELATNQDQLAAKQDQLIQNVAALQEQADRQKPVSPAARPVHPAVQNSLQIAPR